jgi:hypothetical protein
MTTIDSKTLKVLRPEIEKALKDLGGRFGIDFSLGRGTYNHSGVNGSLVLEMAARDEASGKSGAQVLFERHAPLFGLKPDDFGREFTHSRKRFKIVGINPNSKVNCLTIARLPDGKEFVMAAETYRASLLMEELLHKKAA